VIDLRPTCRLAAEISSIFRVARRLVITDNVFTAGAEHETNVTRTHVDSSHGTQRYLPSHVRSLLKHQYRCSLAGKVARSPRSLIGVFKLTLGINIGRGLDSSRIMQFRNLTCRLVLWNLTGVRLGHFSSASPRHEIECSREFTGSKRDRCCSSVLLDTFISCHGKHDMRDDEV
jgi:hypothetical protein